MQVSVLSTVTQLPELFAFYYHGIQVRLCLIVDGPGSRCCFNDDSLADVVDACGVAPWIVPSGVSCLRFQFKDSKSRVTHSSVPTMIDCWT